MSSEEDKEIEVLSLGNISHISETQEEIVSDTQEGIVSHVSETEDESEIPSKKAKIVSSESELYSDYSTKVPAPLPQVPQDAQLIEDFMYISSTDSDRIEASQFVKPESTSTSPSTSPTGKFNFY